MNNFGAKVIICYVLFVLLFGIVECFFKVMKGNDSKCTMIEVTFFITGFIALFSFVKFIF